MAFARRFLLDVPDHSLIITQWTFPIKINSKIGSIEIHTNYNWKKSISDKLLALQWPSHKKKKKQNKKKWNQILIIPNVQQMQNSIWRDRSFEIEIKADKA